MRELSLNQCQLDDHFKPRPEHFLDCTSTTSSCFNMSSNEDDETMSDAASAADFDDFANSDGKLICFRLA